MLPTANITAIVLSLIENGYIDIDTILPQRFVKLYTQLHEIAVRTGISKEDLTLFFNTTLPCVTNVTDQYPKLSKTELNEKIWYTW